MAATAKDLSKMLLVELKEEGARLPRRQTEESAGYDLSAGKDYKIPPGERLLVSTGLRIVMPSGCYGRVAPRSSLAWKHAVDVGAGVIDADYRGTVHVLLINNGKWTFSVRQATGLRNSSWSESLRLPYNR